MNYLNINSYIGKSNGDPIYASTWNGVLENIQTKVNEIIDALAKGTVTPTDPDTPKAASNVVINGQTYTSNKITLEAGKDYTISGTINGQLIFDAKTAKPSENTTVTFDGVTIISDEVYGVLYETPEDNTGYKDLVINLVKDSENYVICNKEVAVADDQPGAIYSMNNLAIKGVGYLAVYNKGGHGVRGTETQIVGPHIYIDATHDGIHGKKLSLDYGYYYIKSAKDIFGTGTNGTILYGLNYVTGDHNGYSGYLTNPKGGHVYYIAGSILPNELSSVNIETIEDFVDSDYTIEQSEDKNFTSTEPVPFKWIKGVLHTIEGSSIGAGLIEYTVTWDNTAVDQSRIISVVNDLNLDLSDLVESVTVKYYNDDTELGRETITLPYTFGVSGEVTSTKFDIVYKDYISSYPKLSVTGDTGDYYWNITKPYVRIKGEIRKQIIVNEDYLNDNQTSSDVTVYLQNAYLRKGVQFLPTSGRIKIVASKDTVNAITSEEDAIKSENNIRIEVKNNAHLVLTAPKGDAIDGDEVVITDSKGTLLITDYALRGIKGTSVVIGPNATIKSASITPYTDPSDENYSTLEGAVVVIKHKTEQSSSMTDSRNEADYITYERYSDELARGFDIDVSNILREYDYIKYAIYLDDLSNRTNESARFELVVNEKVVYTTHSEISFPYIISEEDWELIKFYNAGTLRIYGTSDEATALHLVLPYFAANSLQIYRVTDATNSGNASIYARQGKKTTKGTLCVTDNELKGVLIANSIGATIAYNAADASRFFYKNDVMERSTGLPGVTSATYTAKPYNSTGIAENNAANGGATINVNF